MSDGAEQLTAGGWFHPDRLRLAPNTACRLPYLLGLVGDRRLSQSEVRREVVAACTLSTTAEPHSVRTVRTTLGSNGYGLVDESFRFTEIGRKLYECREDEQTLYDEFARHILLNLHGLKILDIINDLQMAGESTTTTNITMELRRQYDLYVKESSTHWNQMRGWLAQAGVINTGTHHIRVEWAKLDQLAGVESDDRLALAGLSEPQEAFMRALVAIDPAEPIQNNKIREVAETAFDTYIDSKSITSNVLDPLEEAGFIEYEPTVEHSGKPSVVSLTDSFEGDVLYPVLESVSDRTGVPREVLRSSFDEIQTRMDSDLTYVKGRALEALAVKIGRLLDLTFTGWQVRGTETGGAEVDVVMDSTGVSFSRWQIQCKNTTSDLQTKHVAREVGLAPLLQTNVILLVARAGVVPDARAFAKRVMAEGNLTVLFITGDDLDELDEHPEQLTTALTRQTQRTRELKPIDGS